MIMKGKIAEITVSDSHPALRWLKFEDDDRLFSLWDSVNGGKLAVGQLVEFQAERVEGRNFFKITKIKPVSKGSSASEAKAKVSKDLKKQEAKAQANELGFSKTEVGLMVSVAVKAAAAMSKEAKVPELIDKAEAIYAYLKAKRLSEVEVVTEEKE